MSLTTHKKQNLLSVMRTTWILPLFYPMLTTAYPDYCPSPIQTEQRKRHKGAHIEKECKQPSVNHSCQVGQTANSWSSLAGQPGTPMSIRLSERHHLKTYSGNWSTHRVRDLEFSALNGMFISIPPFEIQGSSWMRGRNCRSQRWWCLQGNFF